MKPGNTDFTKKEMPESSGSPILDKLKETPFVFKEPEGYFENLKNEIFLKILEDDAHEQQIIRAYKRGIVRRIFQPRYALAASLLIAVSLIGWHFYNKLKPLKPPTTEEIADVINTEKIQSIDETLLIESLDDEFMIDETYIPDEVIIDYLIENNVDMELITVTDKF